jgi:very-short-patch-repair endonuclease
MVVVRVRRNARQEEGRQGKKTRKPLTPEQKEARKQQEERLYQMFIAAGLPAPERQYRFCRERRWHADFAYLCDDDNVVGIAVEYEGATWVPNMGHSSGEGIRRDVERSNWMNANGWRLFRITADMMRGNEVWQVIAEVKRLLEQYGYQEITGGER